MSSPDSARAGVDRWSAVGGFRLSPAGGRGRVGGRRAGRAPTGTVEGGQMNGKLGLTLGRPRSDPRPPLTLGRPRSDPRPPQLVPTPELPAQKPGRPGPQPDRPRVPLPGPVGNPADGPGRRTDRGANRPGRSGGPAGGRVAGEAQIGHRPISFFRLLTPGMWRSQVLKNLDQQQQGVKNL